jgi:hypothetical protein
MTVMPAGHPNRRVGAPADAIHLKVAVIALG